MQKWGVEHPKSSIKYLFGLAIKTQVLTDFIIEWCTIHEEANRK